ncbi:MAG TPA: hypothetical protein VFG43_15660 [Geminicoccaceae bacterium]|nr:hypothetical protein [Geminicoccaceae bacterium]
MGSLVINLVILIGIFVGTMLVVNALRLPRTFKLVTIGLIGLILVVLAFGLVTGIGPVWFGGVDGAQPTAP